MVLNKEKQTNRSDFEIISFKNVTKIYLSICNLFAINSVRSHGTRKETNAVMAVKNEIAKTFWKSLQKEERAEERLR